MPSLPEVTLSEHQGVRYLHLGDTPWVQGAMWLRKPQALVLEYVQRMMVWMLWRDRADVAHGHAVQLGLGAGSLTRFCHGVLRMDRVTAVELNPGVIAAGHQAFRLPLDDPRLALVQADAGAWAAEPAHAAVAQVLNVDLYDHEAAAPAIDSAAFYADCRRVLAPGGVMTVNLFGRHASFEASAARIAHAFGRDQVWRVRPTREGNTVVVAARGVEVPDRATLLDRARGVEALCGLPARKWLRLVQALG